MAPKNKLFTFMSAPISAEKSPQSIAEIWGSIADEEHTRRAIDQALYALNGNSDRVERVFEKMFKGRTHQDRRFVAKIMRHMFGLKKQEGMVTSEPLHPKFAYSGGRRYMSLKDLHRVLKGLRRGACPTLEQLRRIFDGFRGLGLITLVEFNPRDESGQFRKDASYRFNLDVWDRVWKEAAKPTPFKPPAKKRRRTGPTMDLREQGGGQVRRKPTQSTPTRAVVNDPQNAQTASSERPENTGAFTAPPSGLSAHCCSNYRGDVPDVPGTAGVSSAGSGAVGKEGNIGSSLTEDRADARLSSAKTTPASPASKGPCYVEVPGNPKWQDFLTSWMWDFFKEGNWEQDLYQDAPEGKCPIKPRIPDCLVVSDPIPGRLLGVYDLRQRHLPLTPAELELGDFVERASGCPLRLQDWKLLHAQFNGKSHSRLTKDRLALVLFAACRQHWDSYQARWSGRDAIDILDVVPEMDARSFDAYSDLLTHALVDDLATEDKHSGWLEDVLEGVTSDWRGVKHKITWDFPFLSYTKVNPVALLAPDNAGRMLMAWLHYWRVLVCRLLPERRFRDAGGVTHEAWAPHQITQHGIRDKRMPVVSVALDDLPTVLETACDTFRSGARYSQTDLWPAFKTAAKAGLENLSAEVRSRLTEVTLNIYTKTPHHWCDLDAHLGGDFMARLMPLRNLDQLRLIAQERTRAMLRQECVLPYAKFRPKFPNVTTPANP